MTHDRLEQIMVFLEQETGFLLNEGKKEELSCAISERIALLHVNDSEQYLAYIRSPEGSAELAGLIGNLTVGETYFLRNHGHWKALKDIVIPHFIGSPAKRQTKKIHVWSAGCSTGEEPYTIAITLLETLPFPQSWDIAIIATDINQTSLETAKVGTYSKNSFRGVEKKWIEKYFIQTKKTYRIKENIRKMVHFTKMNLNAANGFPLTFQNFNIIFCKNVLMYFRPEVYTRIVDQFADRLHTGEFLFLGHAEGFMASREMFTPLPHANTIIYQKKSQRTDCGLNKGKTKKTGIQDAEMPNQNIPKSQIPNPESQIPNSKWYEAAFSCYRREDFDTALGLLSKTGTEDEPGLEALILKALIHINRSDLAQAEACCEEISRHADMLPEGYALKGMLHELKHDFKGAVKAFDSAIFLDKDFFASHFKLGNIYQIQGNAGKAHRSFANAKRALKKDRQERIKLFYGSASPKLLGDLCESAIRKR